MVNTGQGFVIGVVTILITVYGGEWWYIAPLAWALLFTTFPVGEAADLKIEKLRLEIKKLKKVVDDGED